MCTRWMSSARPARGQRRARSGRTGRRSGRRRPARSRRRGRRPRTPRPCSSRARARGRGRRSGGRPRRRGRRPSAWIARRFSTATASGPVARSSTSGPPRSVAGVISMSRVGGRQAELLDARLERDQVAPAEVLEQLEPSVVGHVRPGRAASGRSTRRRAPIRWRRRPAAPSAREHGRRSPRRRPSGPATPTSSMPPWRNSRDCAAPRSIGAVGVGEVTEPDRRRRVGVAVGHQARDRDRRIRAQRQHAAVLVEQPVGGGRAAAPGESPRRSTSSYSSAGVHTSP